MLTCNCSYGFWDRNDKQRLRWLVGDFLTTWRKRSQGTTYSAFRQRVAWLQWGAIPSHIDLCKEENLTRRLNGSGWLGCNKMQYRHYVFIVRNGETYLGAQQQRVAWLQ